MSVLSATASRRSVWVFFLISLVAVPLATLGRSSEDDATETDPGKSKIVKLVIDYGDGLEKHFTGIEWREGMTVLDLLEAAQKHPRGIKFVHRGSGALGFLTKIDDLENKGGDRNWIYRVNSKLGDRSFAIQPVKAGDTVLWKFGEYR